MMQKARTGVVWSLLRRYSKAARATADAQLRAGEQTCIISESAIDRIDIAHLASNQPTEDFFATAKCLSSDTFLLGKDCRQTITNIIFFRLIIMQTANLLYFGCLRFNRHCAAN